MMVIVCLSMHFPFSPMLTVSSTRVYLQSCHVNIHTCFGWSTSS